MSSRSWLAVLLLINYLLVVGTGCMNRPEDQRGFVMVQIAEAGHEYQECRYLRMDGLENLLAEALTDQYKTASDTPKHHIISVVPGVDAHCLVQAVRPFSASEFTDTLTPRLSHRSPMPAGVNRSVNAPPWLG